MARGPEIVVIEKGEAVESVEQKGKALRIAKIAGIIIAPLIVGVMIGQIGTNAKQFNRTINDAGKIANEIKEVRKSMRGFQHAFADAKKDGFATFDEKLTDELEKVDYKKPDMDAIYKSWLYELKPGLVADVMYFTTEADKLARDVKAHVTLTKNSIKNLKAAIENKNKAKPPENEAGQRAGIYRYAILVQVPTEEEQAKKPFGSQLVELGNPICDGQVSQTAGCPEGAYLTGFRYRTGPDEPWQNGDTGGPVDGNAPGGKLLPILETGTMETLVRQSGPAYAEKEYEERVKKLAEKTEELVDLAGALENDLNAQAGAGEKFTFFL